MIKLNGGYSGLCALAMLWTTAAIAQPPHFTSLGSFSLSNGAYPWSTLLLGADGDFYGTTQNGGKFMTCASGQGCGTIFKMAPHGKLTIIYNFSGLDGSEPFASLIKGANGHLYGTTSTGGTATQNYPAGMGTVFDIAPGGKLTTLYKFTGNDGLGPNAALLLARDGNFYGTTGAGGTVNGGTIFSMTPAGKLTTLWSFDGTQGAGPDSALVQSRNGDFYGVTLGGTPNGSGIVYRLDPKGQFTMLHAFDANDGGSPYAALVEGKDGNFYGATENGGKNVAYGTIFKMTPGGHLTTLHSFDKTDGDVPVGTMIQGTDGSFYGTTAYGGIGNFGTVFKITSTGKLTTLHSFTSKGGSYPYAGLLQTPGGMLYGDTFAGGPSTNCRFGCGTLFSMSPTTN